MDALTSFLPRSVFSFLFELCYGISRVYFAIVNAVFGLYHLFTTRVSVSTPEDDLLLISATQAARMIRDKEITSAELIDAYIKRIQKVNHIINAVVEDNFVDAREKARAIDKEVEEATPEQIEKVEGLKCTYGLHYRKEIIAEKNATVVQRRICGGSSGGEAALVAAAGSLIGIGSDVGGSIRMPAFFNGVFGLKPTPGFVPLDGHLPLLTHYRTTMLCIGPICRYADDISLIFKVMCGDAVDSLRLDQPISMARLRVFYMDGIRHPLIESTSSEMAYALKRATRYMEMKYDLAAARIDLPIAQEVIQMFITSMEAKGQPPFNEILTDYNGAVNCFTEFFRWLIGRSVHTLPAIVVGTVDGLDLYGESYKQRLLYLRDRLSREVNDLLGDCGVLLFPSFPNTASYHNQPLLTPLNFGYVGLFNALAVPVMQCPMGLSSAGIPLGVQIVGAPRSERNLIAIAKDLEEGFGGWIKP